MDWYAPLLEPVVEMVDAAARRAQVCPGPRYGLGGALTVQVIRQFGRWGEPGRIATAAVERYNAQLFEGTVPEGNGNLRRLLMAVRQWVDPQQAETVRKRLLSPLDVGRGPMPESVLFLRAAVAAGVLAGKVPDGVHASLDRAVTWIGLQMEPRFSREESLRAVGLSELVLEVPDGDLGERIAALKPEHCPPGRRWDRWDPPMLEGPEARGVEERMAALLGDAAPVLQVGMRAIWGGKRLRSQICALSAGVFGGEEPVAAAVVEMVHDASLILDDMLDRASLRRGRPCLHVRGGEPLAAGVALLLLDRAWAALPEEQRPLLLETGESLILGQWEELKGEIREERDCYRVIAGKTASLFGCAAALGAMSAGATEKEVRALRRYGQELGLAFQLVDDLLDYLGETETLGKEPGTDLRADKVTLPALRLQEPWRGRPLEELRERLQAKGVDTEIRRRAAEHCAKAQQSLSGLPEGPSLSALLRLSDQLVARIR